MKAVLLAAGIGSRLYPLTQNKPKALLELNGRTLLDRMMRQLACCGVDDFIVVTGYRDETVTKELRRISARHPEFKIQEVKNPIFNTTGTAYSLWLSMPYWDDDLLIVEGDLVVESEIVTNLLGSTSEAFLLTDEGARLGPEEMKVKTREGAVTAISKSLDPAESQGEYIGLGRFRGAVLGAFAKELDAMIHQGGKTEFYEAALESLARNWHIEAPSTQGRLWTEIDFAADYENARAIFWEERENLTIRTDLFEKTSHSPSLQALFGDFDALHVHDFCYLANPFFPPEGFTREIRMKLELLLRAYPSLNHDIAEKVGLLTGIDPQYIVLGNGAAELIDHITRLFVRKLTLPVPTFSEYLETAQKHGATVHTLAGAPETFFRVNTDRLVANVEANGCNAAVLINPDNPSGQYLPVAEVRALLERLKNLDIVIVDESFSDFATVDTPPTAANLCEQYPNLVVVKSLGKIFGLPGLRLGYMVTADRDRAAELRRQLPVWNVNAVAEFFLDRLPAYRKDYEISRVKVIACTRALREALDRIEGLSAFPSAANFVLARIDCPMTSTELRDKLLSQHNIYVRDCGNKTGLDASYVRVACRTEEENALLVEKMTALLRRRNAEAGRG